MRAKTLQGLGCAAAVKISSPATSHAPEALDFSKLAPFLRVLLVTDGVVTRILDAYFAEPIDVNVLSHIEVRSESCYPDIDVNVGDRIVSRCVVLRGHVTQRPYAFASSILVSDFLPKQLRRRLVEDRKGIGELLSCSRLETYREIIAIGQGEAGELAGHLAVAPDSCVVSRTYKIHLHGTAVMLIKETFSKAMFE